jgi:Spy/CpxP family protein refolding chaperone
MEVSMKRLMISTFATIALLAAATTMLLSHSAATATNRPFVTGDAMSLQDLQKAVDVNKLPVQEFEDMSLVYSTTTH